MGKTTMIYATKQGSKQVGTEEVLGLCDARREHASPVKVWWQERHQPSIAPSALARVVTLLPTPKREADGRLPSSFE